MDIRTKLILALVSVSVASMTVLGVFAYQTSATLFKEVSVRQLEALAQPLLKNGYGQYLINVLKHRA